MLFDNLWPGVLGFFYKHVRCEVLTARDTLGHICPTDILVTIGLCSTLLAI